MWSSSIFWITEFPLYRSNNSVGRRHIIARYSTTLSVAQDIAWNGRTICGWRTVKDVGRHIRGLVWGRIPYIHAVTDENQEKHVSLSDAAKNSNPLPPGWKFIVFWECRVLEIWRITTQSGSHATVDRLLTEARNFSTLLCPHPTSYSVGTRKTFPAVKRPVRDAGKSIYHSCEN
jgi:hypothetical protein